MKNLSINIRINVIINILLTLFYLIGQTHCIFNYDLTVSLGLQESLDQITGVGVAFNKGFGLGDTVIYIPLLIIGIWGLLKRKEIGLYCMFAASAITIYWPIVCMSALYWAVGAPGFIFNDHTTYLILLSAITLFGVWSMVFLYRNRNKLNKQ